MANNKYEFFTDDELYMLSRQAIESSYEIVESDNYSGEERLLHNKLLNEIIKEQKRRKDEICASYHETTVSIYSPFSSERREKIVGLCWGTKEKEECHCGGCRSKCDFYGK